MGYGWNTRSPEDVQRYNGRAYTFDKIKERYEQTVPLRGKRKALDIRPHGERSRTWERIVKVSDNEYYLTNNAWTYYDRNPDCNRSHSRAITFSYEPSSEIETIIIHPPMHMNMGVPSCYYFYTYNLPDGVDMYKHNSKPYIRLSSEEGYKYYFLKDNVVITRKKGDKFFKPLVVHREVHRSLDRRKTKELRKEVQAFLDYVQVMAPLAEAKSLYYGNPLLVHDRKAEDFGVYNSEMREVAGKSWRELVGNHLADDPPEVWFKFVQQFKYRNTHTHWFRSDEGKYSHETRFNPEGLKKDVYQSVYMQEKPFIETEVPLGELCFDKYRYW